MSTKSTVALGDDFHLYDELMDGGLYLEVANAYNAAIEIVEGCPVVKVRLPKALIQRLKLDDVQLVEPGQMFDEGSISNLFCKVKK